MAFQMSFIKKDIWNGKVYLFIYIADIDITDYRRNAVMQKFKENILKMFCWTIALTNEGFYLAKI